MLKGEAILQVSSLNLLIHLKGVAFYDELSSAHSAPHSGPWELQMFGNRVFQMWLVEMDDTGLDETCIQWLVLS